MAAYACAHGCPSWPVSRTRPRLPMPVLPSGRINPATRRVGFGFEFLIRLYNQVRLGSIHLNPDQFWIRSEPDSKSGFDTSNNKRWWTPTIVNLIDNIVGSDLWHWLVGGVLGFFKMKNYLQSRSIQVFNERRVIFFFYADFGNFVKMRGVL